MNFIDPTIEDGTKHPLKPCHVIRMFVLIATLGLTTIIVLQMVAGIFAYAVIPGECSLWQLISPTQHQMLLLIFFAVVTAIFYAIRWFKQSRW